MAHVAAIGIGARAGMTPTQVDDAVHDQPVGADLFRRGIAVKALEPLGPRRYLQCRPRLDRRLLLQFCSELGPYHLIVWDGPWGISHGRLAPAIVFGPRSGFLDHLKP